MRGAHPVRKSVCCELGLVLGHGQVVSNDYFGDDFALARELGRLGREALALIQRGLDLVADCYEWAERLRCPEVGHQLGPFNFELRVGCGDHVCMNGRACSLVRASAVRVCTVPVQGPGMTVCFLCGVVRLLTPYRGGVYGHNLYWSLCATFSASVRAVRCSAWTARAVYLVCICVYIRRSACAARALHHSL